MTQELALWLFGATITILVALLGAMWRHSSAVHKDLFDKLAKQEKAHNDFRVEVAKEYVAKEDMEKLGARLEKALADGLHEVTTSLNNLATQFHEHQLEDRR